MLGMMNKGGSSTNMPVAPSPGAQASAMPQPASMPSKGGGTANVPIPGSTANSGAGLAALFQGDAAAAPAPGGTMPLPKIREPQRPVVEPPPPVRKPVQPAPPSPFAGMGPIRTRADMLNFMQAH